MGQFALLPAELQVKIFGYLGNVDIKAARLVSRGFRDNAAPALFRSIILAPRIEILRISGGTFMHPVYTNYVKELVFDGTLYSPTITADIFFYERMERAWGREFTESDSTIISRFDDYELLYKEQETLLRTGFFKLALARCLEKAPISSIVYSPRQRTIPAETRHQKFLMPTGHPPHWPSGTEITGPEHHFRQLLAAIFETRYTGIRELIIETPCNRDWNTEFAIPIFTFPDSDDLRAGQHLFRNLVRLEVKLCLSSLAHEKGHPRYTESSGETATKQLENLAKVLESAQELKSMCLVLLHWKDSPQSMYGGVFPDGEPIFRRLGLGATWPKLRCLILYGIYAWKQDIIDLIDRHKDTLDDFRLSRCGLCDGTWADVADHIRSKPTTISEFSLGSVYEFNDAYAAYTAEERELWKYQFLLTRGPDGKLEFRDCDPDPNRKSVYDARRS